jgi:hypothetical protein
MTNLAGTPDHLPGLDARLVTIAKLTADLVAAATYASVTALRGDAYTTVAVSDDLIRAVDEAQYADNAGPCLDALDSSAPVGVPDIATTLQWPEFHEAAPRMGLHASVSVPLFAGRGDPVGVLNVYGHDPAAMAPLIAGITLVHGRPGRAITDDVRVKGLDDGGRELVAGYARALKVRASIRFAVELIKATAGCTADDAYMNLCIRASEAGTDLAEAAATVVNRGL